MKLIPFDPATLLMESAARVIREGIANCSSVTAPGNVSWTAGQASPAEHYLVPEAGWQLYTDREPEEVATPYIILTVPEDAKEKSPSLDGLWSLTLQCQVLVDRDYSIPALEAVLKRLQLVLTCPVTLDNSTRQLAQARFSTSALHVHGSRRDENFEGIGTGKIINESGHPERMLAFSVTCSHFSS